MKRLLLIGLLLICMAACGLADYEKLDLEVGEVTNGFRLKSVDELELVHAALYIFEHEATGAQLCYVSNDDTNRCFSIGFRTPVYTDTGIPHVFEHASLSGSEKYPDPNLIMSMMYGTYTTYLNAYTATTYTAYQASSLSEDQLIMDMDVILNGVFHPLLVKDERVMMREAYRYELEDRDSPLTLEGVVYSEMLGAQEHEQMATVQLDRLLYPGSCVGSVSGGLPEKIPEMTFEDLCQFHENYYTPSNSLTVLYGKMNIERYLKMLNETIFAGFERKEMHLEEESYRPAAGDIVAKYTYPASADTEPETVMYYAGLSGMKGSDARRRTAELLDEMNLSRARRRTVGGFSKGMARRVAIAAALVASPELLVLDEPTSGLDPIGTRDVKDLIAKLAAGGMTVLLTSHQLFDVQDVCNRVAVVSEGRKVGGGVVADIVAGAKDKRHALEEYFEERLGLGKAEG